MPTMFDFLDGMTNVLRKKNVFLVQCQGNQSQSGAALLQNIG
jgi:hypothetical protein